MKKIVLSTFLLLQGCVTPYQPNGVGGGFSEMALAKDTYIVSFRGNGFTGSEQVNAYLLRRGAELTKEKGYRYFIILAGKQDVDRSYINTPTTISTSGYGNSSYTGSQFGNTTYLSGNNSFTADTTINPGRRYNINKYKSSMAIKMLKSNIKNVPAFDADVILSNFKNSKN